MPTPAASARPEANYTDSTSPRTCQVENCERTDIGARGMCHKHYQKWRVDTLPGRRAAKRRNDTAANQRYRGTKLNLGRCEECGGAFTVTASGSFRRPHMAADGSKCRGSDLPVSIAVRRAS